jgi:uncharacterized protein (UPF0332 family)
MDTNEFLDAADELCTGPSEGFWRSGVSRAYYAAFHRARRLLRAIGFPVPDSDRGHAYLWLRLSNCGHAEVVTGCQTLNRLRTDRNRADYDTDRPFSQTEAINIVQLASDLVALLESVEAERSVRTIITQAMRDYERNVLGEVTWKS